jgi:uncharacterized protein YqeY
MDSLPDRLRGALRGALKDRDAAATAALRSALGAIANAEAVDTVPVDLVPAVGVGAREVARRDLTDDQVAAIVRAEVTDREAAAREYDGLGRPERAERLRAEAAALTAHLD